ncbi:MAG TPA: hypothetical protein VLE97_10750 [Gaiellaceae bacterium]|nr:hypothetical protein [Gaiellaceae bacterium]
MKHEVKYAMNDGDPCPYCGQTLYVEDGVFQCGGDGEGICSIWCAINDFGRAAKALPAYAAIDVEAWIDAWVMNEVGQSWAEIGWDRELHLRGVRETWNLPTGCQNPPAAGVV